MKPITLLLTTMLLSPLALANSSSDDLMIHNPYARATPPNAPNSAVFMMLHNPSSNERHLISASTSVAKTVELHNHVMEGDMMKMREVDEIVIPAKGMAELKPGSLHIMLFDLKKPLVEGESIDLTLNYANGETMTLQAPIKKVMKGMKKISHNTH